MDYLLCTYIWAEFIQGKSLGQMGSEHPIIILLVTHVNYIIKY